MQSKPHRRIVIVPLTALMLLSIAPIARAAHHNEGTNGTPQQAAELSLKGDLQGALATAQKGAARHPDDWLYQASLSYHSWQMGDNAAAVRAGEEALKYNPRSTTALLNLARMEESLGAHRDASVLYERLSRVAPENPQGGIGLARCYVGLDNRERALTLLKEMSGKNDKSFEWNYQLSQILFQLNQPGLAVENATKALSCATVPEQENKAKCQLLVSLIQNNQTEEAATLAKVVFSHCSPTKYEVFVRAAAKLCRVAQPDFGEEILSSALRNLTGPDDAEGFYKLGRVFQNKAAYVSFDATKYAKWQSLASKAYETAVARDPMQPRYYVALAGTLAQQKKYDKMLQPLKTATRLEPFDVLASRLLTGAQAGLPFKTTKVRFSTKGINCTCHFAKIEQELLKSTNVVFASISRVEPYEAVMLLDESTASAEKVLEQCKTELTGGPATKLFSDIRFTVLTRETISGAEEAVRIAQNANVGDPLLYFDFIAVTPPVLPTADEPGARSVSLK